MEKTYQISNTRRYVALFWFFLGCLFFTAVQYTAYAYLPLMVESAGMDGAQQGLFTGVQSIIAFIMMLIAFYFSNILGKRKAFALGTSFTILTGLCFYVGSFPMLVLGRVILGIANGFSVSLRASLITLLFKTDRKKATFFSSVIMASGYIGKALTMSIAYPLMNHVGSWQMGCLIMGICGLISAIGFLLAYPKEIDEKPSGGSIKKTLDNVRLGMSYPIVRKFAAYYTLSGWSSMAFNSYIIMLLISRYGMETSAASGAQAYGGIAGLVGGILGGMIASRSKTKYVLIPAEFGLFFIMLSFCFMKTPSIALITVMLTVQGFCSAAHMNNNFSLLYRQDGMNPTIMAAASAFVMTCFYLGSYISLQLFGTLYPTLGLEKTFLIWSFPLLISAIVCVTIKEPTIQEFEARKAAANS